MKPVKVLCIGGSDSGGGAGIQADLKAVSACGSWGLCVITAVTAQNSKGVSAIFPVTPAFIGKQIDAVMNDMGTDAVKTGMLPTAEIVQTVVRKIKKYKLKKVVVDPVMIAKGGKTLMPDRARTALIEDLLPLAFAITPNIPEAEIISKMKIASVADMKQAALRIHALGVKNILIKGGHLPIGKYADVTDILYNGHYYEFSSKRINSSSTHGTGCTYAATLAAGIARGDSIVDAALQAKIMITSAIKNGICPGKGYGSVNVFGDLFKLRNK